MRTQHLYKGDSIITYATSIAATWVWAPAIFVASSMGYYNGIYGLGWFIIPNVLTLIIFGCIAHYYVNHNNIDTFINISDIANKSKRQAILHTTIGAVLLTASTCVQLIGMYELVRYIKPDISIFVTSFAVALFCYAYTKSGGIKTCIISDELKYGIIILIVAYLMNDVANHDTTNMTIYGINRPDFISISVSFGIVSAIGLLCAPYIDQTFWQRVFSIERSKIRRTFLLASLLFLFIPLCFGIIGMKSDGNIVENWNIMYAFDGEAIAYLLMFSIFLALIATLDSNICAIQSLLPEKKYASEIMLIASIIICSAIKPSIVDLFLVYGTIRTSMAIPSILIIFDKYDETRLFWCSFIAAVIGGGGYAIASVNQLSWAFAFTIFALIIPLFGMKMRKD